jgi:minor curlin subunit
MRRLCQCRANGRMLPLLGFIVALAASSAAAQERVSIEQVQAYAQRSATGSPATGIQENDYILGSQSGISLLNPDYPPTSALAASNQARALQIGTGNVSNIDQSGYANIAVQSVIGAQNTVTQTQSGERNQSAVSIVGNSNVIGTQQEGSRASVAITVNGNNNAITTQQSANDTGAISITRNGTGAPLTVSRR